MVAGSGGTKSSSSKTNDHSKSSGAGGRKGPSGGSATVRSIGGFPGGDLKQSTQYGSGTEIGGRRYGQALKISGSLVADWDKVGKLGQKIVLDQALVAAALAQARSGLLGPTLNPPTLADIAKARAVRGSSPIGRGLVDPFNAGVVAHWTNGGLAPNYQVGFDALGGMQFSQPTNPAGMQRANQARGRLAGRALNASTIGVANTGTKPYPAQLAAAQNFGSFIRAINPYAQITSHGYLSAPNKVHARSRSDLRARRSWHRFRHEGRCPGVAHV